MAFPLFGQGPARPDDMLPRGWQLYSHPTSLEPAGTIFRIDADGRRSVVARLEPPTARVDGLGDDVRRIECTVPAAARLLGVPLARPLPAGTTRALRFRLTEPTGEIATEAGMNAVLPPFIAATDFRADSRYYVIRETRSARAITFLLNAEEMSLIGGPAAIDAAQDHRVTVAVEDDGVSAVTHACRGRLGVMFLAEEIVPVKAGLAGETAAMGRAAVPGAMEWVDPDHTVVQVFFATDRTMTAGAPPRDLFGGTASTLRYGTCDVSIPRDHRMGDLEAPSAVRFEFREDPARHVVLLTATVRPRAEFFAELAARVRQAETAAAFLFVHGFAVTFEDAARRTAQMAYDLGFSGAPIFYSWPSAGSKLGYRDDEQTIDRVKDRLRDFLIDVLEQSQAEKVYLIAHSMGNRALTHAIGSVLADRPDLGSRVSEVILTAPDIDAEVFTRDIAPALLNGGRPITLYASSKDLALEASKLVNGAPRAGDAGAGLVVIRGIETIDASAVDTSLVGHSYFAEERSVLSDVFYLVREGFRADRRFGLRARNIDRGRYWVFRA